MLMFIVEPVEEHTHTCNHQLAPRLEPKRASQPLETVVCVDIHGYVDAFAVFHTNPAEGTEMR